ncbi:MAG: biotin--[acetyl-CoA-carboxylase] ligase [Planctomycetaceae bacterium]
MDSGNQGVAFSLPEFRQRVLTETTVRTLQIEDEVGSTNTLAQQTSSLLESDQLPALFVTRRQTGGRGRGRNSWWFGEGALAFTLLIEPSRWGIAAARWPTLSLAVGGAVATVIDRWFPDKNIRLKWPNDVYFDGRKGCGILNESVPQSAERLVLGIGINVNNSFATAPEEVRQRGVSLMDLTGHECDIEQLLLDILKQMDSDFTELAVGSPQLVDRWRRLCLLTGSIVTVEQGGSLQTGTCLGLEHDGALRLQTAAGPQRLYSGMVIEF